MSRPSEYDDGLDADGYPLETAKPVDDFPGDIPMPRPLGHIIKPIVAGLELSVAVSRHTESPIETILAVAILRQWSDVEFRTFDAGPARGWTLIPQYPWGSFRVDLALRKPDGFLIFIECDGKDFHCSPEQVERDAVRERMMVEGGYPVIRFTGSEINYSPTACANKLRRFRRWGS
jgi:very-short-patch-repair endonuclease